MLLSFLTSLSGSDSSSPLLEEEDNGDEVDNDAIVDLLALAATGERRLLVQRAAPAQCRTWPRSRAAEAYRSRYFRPEAVESAEICLVTNDANSSIIYCLHTRDWNESPLISVVLLAQSFFYKRV